MIKSYQRTLKICLLISSFIFLCGVDACNRFTDNYDGTVTDKRTGLVWLKNANCFTYEDEFLWDYAMSSAASLNSGECGLTDRSSEGEWRLPTKEELQGIGADPPTTWYEGKPTVTWESPGFPFVEIQEAYWSSSLYETDEPWGFSMGVGTWGALHNGYTGHYKADQYALSVWPAREAN